jgi:hypothetical protein
MVKTLALIALLGAALLQNQRGQRPPQEQGIKKGVKATTFKLDLLQEGKTFDLKDHVGKKPVVVVFGSYT